MDYPHGHRTGHHRPDRREEEEERHGYRPDRRGEEEYPPPGSHPPPYYGVDEPPPPPGSYPPPYYGVDEPPPPPVHHTSHIGPGPPDPYYPRPPQSNNPDYFPPPPRAPVDNRPHNPHFPPSTDHHGRPNVEEVEEKPSVKMYCKGETNLSLTIRDGKVVLARSDPSDPFQHWIRDEKWSTRVKDEEGFPSFALVNKATGEAMKHSTGASHPVRLIPYNPNVLDETVLWTESKDLGDGYRAIRMVNHIKLNVDAFKGETGVHDGTTVGTWQWKKADNQRWKIVPY